MNVTIKQALLESAVTRLSDATSTANLGRSYPAHEMLTDTAETVHAYFEAVRVATEALADAAEHAATSVKNISLEFDDADVALARGVA